MMIRPLEQRDASDVFSAVVSSRDALRQWMAWYSDGYDLLAAQSWIELTLASRAAGTGFHFAICDADGSVIGVVSLEGNGFQVTETRQLGSQETQLVYQRFLHND